MADTLKTGILLLLAAFLLTSCDKFEFRGFVSSYESANKRFEQSIEWNNTHAYKQLSSPENTYSIFAMGDSHVGPTVNLNRFLDSALVKQAVAAVMVGDITTGHKDDFYTVNDVLDDVDAFQTFQVVGNHDLYFDGWQTFYQLFGSTTYYFTVETPSAKDLYICLDSGSGTLGSKQLEWVTELLENKRDDFRYCVVFMHDNLFRIRHTTSTNPPVEEVQALIQLSIEHSVDMIVTGHDHKKNVVQLGHTTHITMDALLDGYNDAGYFELTAGASSLSYRFVNF